MMAKENKTDQHKKAIDRAHSRPAKPNPIILQCGRNIGYTTVSVLKQAARNLTSNKK